MRILVTNDDGIHALGLYQLAKALAEHHDVTVIAPAIEQSGKSRAITLHTTMQLQAYTLPGLDIPAYSLSGTPADCARVGLSYLLDDIDLVFSGINRGYNIGTDVPYSGTVSAALESLHFDVPAIAVSAELCEDDEIYTYTARMATAYFERIKDAFVQRAMVLNINVPVKAMQACQGFKAVSLANSITDYYICEGKNNDSEFLRIAGRYGKEALPGSDWDWLRQGYITVSPLNNGCSPDMMMDLVSGWLPTDIC